MIPAAFQPGCRIAAQVHDRSDEDGVAFDCEEDSEGETIEPDASKAVTEGCSSIGIVANLECGLFERLFEGFALTVPRVGVVFRCGQDVLPRLVGQRDLHFIVLVRSSARTDSSATVLDCPVR